MKREGWRETDRERQTKTERGRETTEIAMAGRKQRAK